MKTNATKQGDGAQADIRVVIKKNHHASPFLTLPGYLLPYRQGNWIFHWKGNGSRGQENDKGTRGSEAD